MSHFTWFSALPRHFPWTIPCLPCKYLVFRILCLRGVVFNTRLLLRWSRARTGCGGLQTPNDVTTPSGRATRCGYPPGIFLCGWARESWLPSGLDHLRWSILWPPRPLDCACLPTGAFTMSSMLPSWSRCMVGFGSLPLCYSRTRVMSLRLSGSLPPGLHVAKNIFLFGGRATPPLMTLGNC